MSKQDLDNAVEAVKEITCPFCVDNLPAREVVDDEQWMCVPPNHQSLPLAPFQGPDSHANYRNHVFGDIEPFVCLVEDCNSPNDMHHEKAPWQDHMREHSLALQWRCGIEKQGSKRSSNGFIKHMKTAHNSKPIRCRTQSPGRREGSANRPRLLVQVLSPLQTRNEWLGDDEAHQLSFEATCTCFSARMRRERGGGCRGRDNKDG